MTYATSLSHRTNHIRRLINTINRIPRTFMHNKHNKLIYYLAIRGPRDQTHKSAADGSKRAVKMEFRSTVDIAGY